MVYTRCYGTVVYIVCSLYVHGTMVECMVVSVDGMHKILWFGVVYIVCSLYVHT